MFDSAWYLAMAQIQFKKKIRRREQSLTFPNPNVRYYLIFVLAPPPTPLKVDVICVSPLTWGTMFYLNFIDWAGGVSKFHLLY